ncbi:MAG: FtsW/RodA/SpoVE family cell cycle protein [Erysipelothrix sp.]|nr:FtsW/RodA/SpoVE family cell cycle protein [Erysipelothrix sp.]
MTPTRLNETSRSFKIDWMLVILILLLAAVSIVAIFGAIPLTPSWVNGQDLLIKQVMWYVLGFITLGFLIFMGVDRLFSMSHIFYWILIVLLGLLILDSFINLPLIAPINGARAWIQIPGVGTIQPSEFMKIILIIRASEIIHSHQQYNLKMSYANDFVLFLKIAKILWLPLILIVLQPDTGIPIIIVVSLIVMLAMSSIKPQWLIIGGFTAFISLAGFIFLFESNPELLGRLMGGSYKLTRFYGWLHPEKYILTWGAQLYTALMAIGSAGFTGHGAATLAISFAEPQNDFIFAVIAKNYGLIGVGITMIVSLLFNLKLLFVALNYDGLKEKYMVAGLLGMLFFQQIQNMGMVVGLFPITGITLPLISAGGSSLLSYMIPLAVIFHMSSENKNKTVH